MKRLEQHFIAAIMPEVTVETTFLQKKPMSLLREVGPSYKVNCRLLTQKL